MSKKRTHRILSLILAAGFISASAAAKNAGSIQIKGSDTMVNLVQAWAEDYVKVDPNVFIAVTGGGSGTGLAALINGSCDIAMSSREIKFQEVEQAKKENIVPKEYKVALDGLAVVVNLNNSVSKLTIDQLVDIFTGKIKNWKEIGGSDSKIVVLSREVNSGTHVYFKENVLRKGDAKSKEEFLSEALLMSSSQAIADEIKQNPDAIGYYGMGYIGKDHKAIAVAKNASLDYVTPTVENVSNGTYPISRPLFLYTNGKPQGALKSFIDYLLSPEGQEVVLKSDFVPIKHY